MKKVNRKMMEDILVEIGQEMVVGKPVCKHDGMVFPISGTVGDDVHFLGEYFEDNNNLLNRAEIELTSDLCGKLGSVVTYSGFVTEEVADKEHIGGALKCKIDEDTEIVVTSPNWEPEKGRRTALNREDNYLTVYHAQRESADSAVNRIFYPVISSKEKKLQNEKLRKFNFSAKTTDCTADQHFDRKDQSQPTDREM